ncbi:MAG: pentapeptide repeat-containing protein, partial [Candidatus Nanopelagicales bacterium]
MTRPLLDILVEHVGQPLPEGCDSWSMRSVRWPWPGQWAEAPGPILDHRGSCPRAVGDGLCVATTAEGMASGGIPAVTVLLTAHHSCDVIGDYTSGKLRTKRIHVVDVIDLPGLVREGLMIGADLHGADLHGADLHGADLHGADLAGADLAGADLHGADLRGAE